TLPATRLETNRVPLSPQVMARALLIPCAQRETLNPGGTLIFSIGISPGALGAGGWAMGASGESASSRGWPCFQVGGACWARVSEASASTTPSASASDVRMMRRMVSLPSRIERTLFAARTIRPGLLVCQGGPTGLAPWTRPYDHPPRRVLLTSEISGCV